MVTMDIILKTTDPIFMGLFPFYILGINIGCLYLWVR